MSDLKATGAGKLIKSNSSKWSRSLFNWLGNHGRMLEGHLDGCDGSKVWGWAIDVSAPGEPQFVELLIDGSVAEVHVASLWRKDLEVAGYGEGNYAFEIPIPTKFVDGSIHTIGVRRSGSTQLLPGSNLEINLNGGTIFANLDEICFFHAQGWLTPRSNMNGVLYLIVNDQIIDVIVPENDRTDIDGIYSLDWSLCGFSRALPGSVWLQHSGMSSKVDVISPRELGPVQVWTGEFQLSELCNSLRLMISSPMSTDNISNGVSVIEHASIARVFPLLGSHTQDEFMDWLSNQTLLSPSMRELLSSLVVGQLSVSAGYWIGLRSFLAEYPDFVSDISHVSALLFDVDSPVGLTPNPIRDTQKVLDSLASRGRLVSGTDFVLGKLLRALSLWMLRRSELLDRQEVTNNLKILNSFGDFKGTYPTFVAASGHFSFENESVELMVDFAVGMGDYIIGRWLVAWLLENTARPWSDSLVAKSSAIHDSSSLVLDGASIHSYQLLNWLEKRWDMERGQILAPKSVNLAEAGSEISNYV